MNEIVFPGRILQPPFFDATADDAVNYGAIAVVIGHEIGHGFDDQGAKFDAEGNLRNWWTEADNKEFDKRTGCIVNQFNSFDALPGSGTWASWVTGEAPAPGDLARRTCALARYQGLPSLAEGREGPVINGLTADQRFYIAFARVWGHQRPH